MRLLEVLEVFGMVWKALQALGGFVRLCAVLRGVERLWEALGGFIDFGWLCHALGGFGFGRLWEAFEKPWGALGGCGFSIVCLSPRLWEALGSFGSLWEVWEGLGGSGSLWKALVCFGRLWEALEGMGRLWEAFGCFGMLWKVGSLALVQWMLWKVLEALGVFERYGRLLEDFRKL